MFLAPGEGRKEWWCEKTSGGFSLRPAHDASDPPRFGSPGDRWRAELEKRGS